MAAIKEAKIRAPVPARDATPKPAMVATVVPAAEPVTPKPAPVVAKPEPAPKRVEPVERGLCSRPPSPMTIATPRCLGKPDPGP